jgi:hypothetical protein
MPLADDSTQSKDPLHLIWAEALQEILIVLLLSKCLYEPFSLPSQSGSFDSVELRFAKFYFAQDDTY